MSELSFRLMDTEEKRAQVFEMFKAQDLLKINMHGWEDPQLSDWLEMTENGSADVWLCDGWGTYYLTNCFGTVPLAHFAVWKEKRREAKKFLCAALEHVFKTYSFPAVMGLTPKRFRHVFPLITSCGFEILGEVAGTVVIRGKADTGVLSVYRRK